MCPAPRPVQWRRLRTRSHAHGIRTDGRTIAVGAEGAWTWSRRRSQRRHSTRPRILLCRSFLLSIDEKMEKCGAVVGKFRARERERVSATIFPWPELSESAATLTARRRAAPEADNGIQHPSNSSRPRDRGIKKIRLAFLSERDGPSSLAPNLIKVVLN